MGKVEVTILNQSFTFVGDDEERIKRAAQFVDEEIRAAADIGIVNTLNTMIMAMMKIADAYLDLKEKFEKVEDKTLRLLRKVENIESPCGVRDKW